METTQIQVLTETFEGHAQQTESGVEYWLARDLQQLLGYAEWRNFNQTAISKAKTACEVSGHGVCDHFVDVNKMIQISRFDQLGSGVLNIHKYWPIFSPNTEPIFRETPHGFELILPLPESRLESGLESRLESAPVEAPVEALVEALVELAETEKKIVVALSTNMLGKKDLLGLLDYRQATGNYKKSINKLLQAGLIERTLPDKPNSRLQKYRLTEKGRLATVRVKDRP
jgi:hypothetical protein